MIIFLKCSSNNKASTVLAYYSGGCSEFGLPYTLLRGRPSVYWLAMNEQIKILFSSLLPVLDKKHVRKDFHRTPLSLCHKMHV